MTLLITGGGGFVMSHLARTWLEADERAGVLVLDTSAPDGTAERFFAPVAERLDYIRADVLDSDDALYELTEGAPDDGSAAVYIGAENPRVEFNRCSVIVARYGVPSEASGVVGMIGPTRLAYQRAVPVVEAAATLLSDFVTEAYYGYPASGESATART